MRGGRGAPAKLTGRIADPEDRLAGRHMETDRGLSSDRSVANSEAEAAYDHVPQRYSPIAFFNCHGSPNSPYFGSLKSPPPALFKGRQLEQEIIR